MFCSSSVSLISLSSNGLTIVIDCSSCLTISLKENLLDKLKAQLNNSSYLVLVPSENYVFSDFIIDPSL